MVWYLRFTNHRPHCGRRWPSPLTGCAFPSLGNLLVQTKSVLLAILWTAFPFLSLRGAPLPARNHSDWLQDGKGSFGRAFKRSAGLHLLLELGHSTSFYIYIYVLCQWTFIQTSRREEWDEAVSAGGAGAIAEYSQVKWFPSRCSAEFG